MNNQNSVKILFKIPRILLERLDVYAEDHTDGNRSAAIRRAIRRLLRTEERPQEVEVNE